MMVSLKRLLLVLAIPTLLVDGCGKGRAESDLPTEVAATNSYLECVARDLLDEGAPVVQLSSPGMCPGHFDLSPSQAQQLQTSRLLFRFEFQTALDARVSDLVEAGLCICPVRAEGGLCCPATYAAACRQAADALVKAGLLPETRVQPRLERIARRMAELEQRCRRQIQDAGLAGRPVVCSVHQEAFCRWLGLEVVGTFKAADVEALGTMAKVIENGRDGGASLVIANRSEGRRLADGVGSWLAAEVVVFGNFPDSAIGQRTFDDLVDANVEALIAAAEPAASTQPAE